jgi:hypothetical protein
VGGIPRPGGAARGERGNKHQATQPPSTRLRLHAYELRKQPSRRALTRAGSARPPAASHSHRVIIRQLFVIAGARRGGRSY